MATLKKRDLPHYSFDDYQNWEGDWELIGGIPFAMSPAPVKIHQQLIGYIFSELVSRTGSCPECEILIDSDWKLSSDTVLKPDVAVVCGDDNPTHIAKTPELIFEVVSPSTARRDEGLKHNLYQEAGVLYYVLVYPDDLIAIIHENERGKFNKVAECDTETHAFTNLTCPVELNFGAIFQRFRR